MQKVTASACGSRSTLLGRLIFALALCAAPQAIAATYYVDSAQGSDSAQGTSPTLAWKTFAKINATQFRPGDQILLSRGRSWFEQLTIPSSGAADAPITVGSYGEGQPPLIDAQSIRNRGISIVGKSYVAVNDVAIQNSTSYSIEVFNSGHITIANCAIKDSKGNAIQVAGFSPDVRVDGCSYSTDPQFLTSANFVSIFSTVDGAVVSNNKIAGFTGRMAISFFDVNNAIAFGNVIDGGGIGIAINACSRDLTGGQIHDNTISNISTAQGDGEAIELTGHVGPVNPHCEQVKAHPDPVFTVSAEIYNNHITGGSKTFGGIDGWHAVQSRIHDNQLSVFQNYGMQWTAGCTDNEFYGNEIRGARIAAIAIFAGRGTGSAFIHNNILSAAPVGMSADAGAAVKEDYNTLEGVSTVRSASIPAGQHTHSR